MAINDEISQRERRRILLSDVRVRNGDTSSYLDHAQAQADELSQGRFRVTGTPNVIGAAPIPSYPAGPAWSTDPGSQVVEPPLSADENPGLEPSADPCILHAEDTGGAEAPSSVLPLDVEHAAPPSSSSE